MTKEESEKFVAGLLELTPKNVIRNMRNTKLLHITKNWKFYCIMANEYVAKMSMYSKYCREEERESWTQDIENVISYAGEVNDYTLTDELHSYQDAGEIMEFMFLNNDWEEIKKIVNKQGHTIATISSLGQKLLRFSPNGVEFVEKIIGEAGLQLLTSLNKVYEEQKSKVAQLVLSNKKQ